MNNSVIRSKVKGDIKEAYKPYVVDIGTENVTKVRCIIKDKSGKECGVQLGKINQTIKRHCARKHKFDPVALAEVDVGPYTDKLAYMKDSMALTIGHNLPFNFWNSPLVKSREKRLQSGFIVNWSDKLVKRTLDDDFATMMRDLGNVLRKTLACMKFDLATRKGRHIQGIACQFIEKWRIRIVYIGMTTMNCRSTSKNIVDGLDEALADLDLDNKHIYTTTTDGGANVERAQSDYQTRNERQFAAMNESFDNTLFNEEAPELESIYNSDDELALDEDGENEEGDDYIPSVVAVDMDPNVPDEDQESELPEEEEPIRIPDLKCFNEIKCAAHVVQLAVNGFINKRRRKINMIKAHVKKIRNSMSYIERENRPAKPTLANITRWSSTYKMVWKTINNNCFYVFLIKFTILFDPQMASLGKVCMCCPKLRKNTGVVNKSVDWQFVDNMIAVLKPVATLTTQLQAEQYIVGDFFRDYTIAHIELTTLITKMTKSGNTRRKNMATKLQEAMRSREGAFDSPALKAALYLDPRFNNRTVNVNNQRMTPNDRKIAIVSINRHTGDN